MALVGPAARRTTKQKIDSVHKTPSFFEAGKREYDGLLYEVLPEQNGYSGESTT